MAKNNWGKVVNFLALIGLILVAVVLAIQKIFHTSGTLVFAMSIIGQSIAYLVTAICAFFYVRSKRNIWWWIVYTVAAVLVVVFMVLLAI